MFTKTIFEMGVEESIIGLSVIAVLSALFYCVHCFWPMMKKSLHLDDNEED